MFFSTDILGKTSSLVKPPKNLVIYGLGAQLKEFLSERLRWHKLPRLPGLHKFAF